MHRLISISLLCFSCSLVRNQPTNLISRNELEFTIRTTFNGESIAEEDQVTIGVNSIKDTKDIQLCIEAPFYNDPAPLGESGKPFMGLWNHEVVEIFFLNDKEQYVEVEIGPHGHHLVLLLNGQRNTIRHSLPLDVEAHINGSKWSAKAIIPTDYLPSKVSKLNAYAIHGVDSQRQFLSLYPAEASTIEPDFHNLKYFQPFDISNLKTFSSKDNVTPSTLWESAVKGIFRYEVVQHQSLRSNLDITKFPASPVTLQGFEGGVEFNYTMPNITKNASPIGFMVIFTNRDEESLKIQLPVGESHSIDLLDNGHKKINSKNFILDYYVDTSNTTHIKGSALIPPPYFPPNITSMSLFAIYSVFENEDSENVTSKLTSIKYTTPIDFNLLVQTNLEYSKLWIELLDKAKESETPVTEATVDKEGIETKNSSSAELIPTTTELVSFEDEEKVEVYTKIPETYDIITSSNVIESTTQNQFSVEPVQVETTESEIQAQEILTEISQDLEVKPELVSVEPELVSIESEIVSVDPEIVSVEPELVSNKPELVSVKPEAELDGIDNILQPVAITDTAEQTTTQFYEEDSSHDFTSKQKELTTESGIGNMDQNLSEEIQFTTEVNTEEPEIAKEIQSTTVADANDMSAVTDKEIQSTTVSDVNDMSAVTDKEIQSTTEANEEDIILDIIEHIDIVTEQTDNFEFQGSKDINTPTTEADEEKVTQNINGYYDPTTVANEESTHHDTTEQSDLNIEINENNMAKDINKNSFLTTEENKASSLENTNEQEPPKMEVAIIENVSKETIEQYPSTTAAYEEEAHTNILQQFTTDATEENVPQEVIEQIHTTPEQGDKNIFQEIIETRPPTKEMNQEILPIIETTNEILSQDVVNQNIEEHNQAEITIDDVDVFTTDNKPLEQSIQDRIENDVSQAITNKKETPASESPFDNPLRYLLQTKEDPEYERIEYQRRYEDSSSFKNNNKLPLDFELIINSLEKRKESILNSFNDVQFKEKEDKKSEAEVTDEVPLIDFVSGFFPPSHPICFTEGLVRDTLRCQVFYECVIQNGEWEVYNWRCKRGFYFDTEAVACLRGYC